MEKKTENKIRRLLDENPVILFMKGTPQEPKCGFSARVVYILNKNGIKFSYFNVLEDEEIRQGIKEFASWPTIPQIYVNGEFMGGCDILMEMEREGKVKEELGV